MILPQPNPHLFAFIGAVAVACAALSDIPPAALESAKCGADALRTLKNTSDVEIWVARHYPDPAPLITYEYRDESGHIRSAWFEIDLRYSVSSGRNSYMYSYPGDDTVRVSLPQEAKNALETQCGITEWWMG